MPPSPDPQSRTSTPRSFTNQTASAEDLLKSQTVGLVNLSDFRKRRAEVLEQKEREAHDKTLGRFAAAKSRSATPSTPGDVTDGASTPQNERSGPPLKKKKKKSSHLARSKLSFRDEEEDEETAEDSAVTSGNVSDRKSPSKTPAEGSPKPPSRKFAPNPKISLPPPKVVTKAAMQAEAEARDALRREFLAVQDAVKATEITIPFIFYDGTNIPGGKVKVKKGDPIWLFLDRCRKVGAELGVAGAGSGTGRRRDNRREWARVGVDDLLCVRGEVIIPHHYEFYYFIANRVPTFDGSGGLLFDYTNTAPPSAADDQTSKPLEGNDMDPTLTKVVDRRWYEKNKHIFPASLWREYEPGEEFIEKMSGVRKDGMGNTFFF
ncbi:hypothetical protein AJ80_04951 [Polytolypa hystricis UAMH7299]|uniref:FAM50A/XAP5 C-terminal domain-containing protein n=1 Tax=Polytolypa hystricis (strain UAMH7299) TaxID=1447883 RepID=A0A2B7Y824_POLH7|nr:hypothetical protein AJ80_04951 [Polytolypa hystricis UAMH7299]